MKSISISKADYVFNYFHHKSGNGFLPLKYSANIKKRYNLSHKRYYSFISLLLKNNYITESNGGYRLISRKKIYGKHNIKRWQCSAPKDISYSDFVDCIILSFTDWYNEQQEHMILLKGGIKSKSGRLLNKYKLTDKNELSRLNKERKKIIKNETQTGIPSDQKSISQSIRPVQMTTRMLSKHLGLSQSNISLRLRNLRDRGMIIYRSIIKRSKIFIPQKAHKYFNEYLYNIGNMTFVHFGSLIKTKLKYTSLTGVSVDGRYSKIYQYFYEWCVNPSGKIRKSFTSIREKIIMETTPAGMLPLILVND